jgi:hypothetical protein
MCGCAAAIARAVVAFLDAVLVGCFLSWFRSSPVPVPVGEEGVSETPTTPTPAASSHRARTYTGRIPASPVGSRYLSPEEVLIFLLRSFARVCTGSAGAQGSARRGALGRGER